MGRFDALTQLDKKPLQPTPPPVVPAVRQTRPSENEIEFACKKQTSKPVNLQTSLHANLQTSKDASSKHVNLQTCKRVNR